jgi:hypothetical protein
MNLHGKGWSEDLSSKEIVVDDIQKIENKFQNSLNKEIKHLQVLLNIASWQGLFPLFYSLSFETGGSSND